MDYKAPASYFVDGVTWDRLREIATLVPAAGGLALFKDSSLECKRVFGNAPAAIVEGRPETDLSFLKVLAGKEHVLHRLASKDLTQRSLGDSARQAILNLGDIKVRILRRVLQEVLERCMYLARWSGKRPEVASSTSWDALMQAAIVNILELEITQKVLERFNKTEEDMTALSERPRTWVALAILDVVHEEHLVGERLQETLDFHRSVTDAAAAHLNLLFNNTFRTPWLAAKLLSKDPAQAKDAACALVKHLDTTRPANRTAFEDHLASTEHLWETLVSFSQDEPAGLLWHNRGKYGGLFKSLAPKFLFGP